MQNIKEYVLIKKNNLKLLIDKLEVKPCLSIVQVGDNPASNSYVKGKMKDCDEVGIKCNHLKLDENISQEFLNDTIISLNSNSMINGIIVQLPLPKHLNLNLDLINKEKDVDGFKIDSPFVPCTPLGIIKYLEDNNVEFDGKNVVVIGRSDIVGKPMAKLFQDRNATVTICHSHTKDISFYTRNADIIVVATGKINTLKRDMIGNNKPIVIDVGINRNENGKLCGDCDYSNIIDICSFVSPVPGGVGLLTRLSLLENVKKTLDYLH